MYGLRTKVAAKGDRLHVMWDVDDIYYECVVTNVFVHNLKRFHDLRYSDDTTEFYVNLGLRKWRFVDHDANRYPRKERDEPHPDMNADDFPKEGDKVEIRWHVDGEFYPGVVTDVTEGCLGRVFHDINYDSGDVELVVDLCYRDWRYLGETALEDEEAERVEEARTLSQFDTDVKSDVRKLIRS